uniref:Col_cuticle_N domain-containing protein n=1 Tax=Syphacia muris TaxID=451379 RepID=A0A0N5AF02_9BILA
MPKQEFEFIDYLGPLAVALAFAFVVFILSIIFNFLLIRKDDDRTVIEKFGSTFDLRCGVHRMRHRPNEEIVRQVKKVAIKLKQTNL